MTHDILYIYIYINLFGPFLSLSVRFGIGATIRTHREIQCLPYAGFFAIKLEFGVILTII